MLRAVVVVLGVLVCGVARAERVELAITGVGYDVPARLAQEAAAALDRVVAFDEEVLGLHLPEHVALRVRVFADRAEYDRVAASIGAFQPGSTLGFFNMVEGGVLWRNADADQLRATLVHEAAHYLLALGRGRAPMWMNEGLSELFERFRVSGNAVWAEPDASVVAWLAAMPSDRRPSVRDLLGASESWWRSMQGPLGKAWYTYGWALCSFLTSSPHGKATLGAAQAAYARAGNAGVLAAFESTYPGGLAAADRDWARWAGGGGKAVVLDATSTQAAEVRPRSSDPCPGGILMRKGDQSVCVR